MTESKKVSLLLTSLAAIFIIPYIGSYIKYEGIFPVDYFLFPHLTAPAKDCFSLPLFIVGCVVAVFTLVFYIFPKWFGFKKTTISIDPILPKVKLPKWFWVGLIMWAVPMVSYIFQMSTPKLLVNWAVLPLFWGFTLMLDGWVYVRRCGHSIIADNPKAIIGIGVSAILGWMIFEYLNNFVADSWYYPKADLIPQDEFVVYAVIGSSGLIPPAVEWYALLRTFRGFTNRYTNGPKITSPNWVTNGILIFAVLALFFTPFFPNQLYAALWYSPLIILTITLEKCGIWTPFTAIKNGNWSFVLLLALSYLFQGFLFESWNYLSASHIAGAPDHCGVINQVVDVSFNPNYWVYSIPYLSVFHVFEMPILGYLGYLPFGVYCGVWWILFAYLLDIKTDFEHKGY